MKKLILGLSTFLLFACNIDSETKITEQKDPLPSWNNGKTKKEIINYVKEITNKNSIHFIEVKDRIATFDNDGNLWSEKPIYFQLYFAIDRVKELASEHPEWKNTQPFKAVLENDIAELMKHGENGLLKLVMATHANINTDEFEKTVTNWLKTAKHPTLNKPFTDLVYQPMLELIKYLQNNQFKTFIVSGGGIDFMRPWVEEVYGIPKDQVIGSSIKTTYNYNNGKPEIKRLPEINFINDKAGKPEGINRHIGRKPIFASGNSDGDLEMMRWTASNKLKSFMLYTHHTDSVREWAYDRTSHIGKLNKGLDEAKEKSWNIIDMEKDWKIIYPFELDKQ